MRHSNYIAKKTNSLWSAMIIAAAWGLMGFAPAQAQSSKIVRDYNNDGYNVRYAQFIEIDPLLEVEIWTDNETGVYYEGEEIRIYFRSNMDCYVAIYNIDTDGLVNLIYPIDQFDDPFIEGGRIYRIPDNRDDYDLVVRGPEGSENLQIVASLTPMPIPDWYQGSGLVADRDRYEFIEYINGRYFGCRSGCFRAIDNVSFVVRAWDNYYYRPVYYSPWPVWRSYGSIYIDCWWGSTIYIDGYYYGCAPLFIPRLYYGHHIVTIYDHHGHAWEGNIRVSHDGPVHLDNTIIRTGAGVKSRYKSVRNTGFLNPAKHGYPTVRATSKIRPKSSVKSTKIVRSKVTNGSSMTVKTTKTSKGVYGYKKVDNTKRKGDFTSTSIDRARTKSGKAGKSTVSGKSTKKRLEPYKDGPSGKTKSLKGRKSSGKGDGSSVYRGKTRSRDSRKAVRSGSSSGYKSGKVRSRGRSSSSSKSSSGRVSSKKGSSSSKAVKQGKSSSGSSSKSGRVGGKSGGRSGGKAGGRSGGRSGGKSGGKSGKRGR